MSNYIDELKEIIFSIDPLAKLASGNKFILTKCVFCGDGKHETSRHLYICIKDDTIIPWCYCHLCHGTTLITPEFLSTYYDVYDINILSNVYSYNKKIFRENKNLRFVKDFDTYNISNNFITEDDLSQVKLKYINKRLGTSLNYDDILKNKIVLNLLDLLDTNNIDKYTRSYNIICELSKSFIGFISTDNAFINLRNLRKDKIPIKSIDKRYINYNIFDKKDNTKRFYILPTNIDLNNPLPIKICISEGPFDILSIYYNLRNKESHVIYAAILGSGYVNIIKHFINKLKLINIEFHIYKDNDTKEYVLNHISNILYPLNIPVYVHNNTYVGEKDFGVSKEKIIDNVIKLL